MHTTLGQILESYDKPCENAKQQDVQGIDINKCFIPTKANLSKTDTSKYKRVPKNYFSCNLMHIGRDERIPIALNRNNNDVVVSKAYLVFGIKEEYKSAVLPEFLYMRFLSKEFDRQTWFKTDSSIRGNLPSSDFFDIKVFVPPINIQRRYVDFYIALQTLIEDNESLYESLQHLCAAKISEALQCSSLSPLGDHIEEVFDKNENNSLGVSSVRGISIEKKFIPTKAKMKGVSLKPYKYVRPQGFGYVTVTSRNGNKISLAMNRSNQTYLISSSYISFKVKSDLLWPEYLYLFFNRPEFDRLARFNSWGSARETFDFLEMKLVKIPLPSIEIQRSLVELYKSALEAKNIAEDAKQMLQSIAPVIIQKAIKDSENG